MCFHISIINNYNSIEEEMNAKFVNKENFNPKPHISAFSNPVIPVIISKNIQEINLFNWGLIPHWVKNIDEANTIRQMTYNAKSETVNQKPSFKYSIKNKKCLITAGPTIEPIDPIRNITNNSSGKQGYEIAKQMILSGANVTLISGPTNI